MNILELPNFEFAAEEDGAPAANATLSVYHAGTDQLCAMYSDLNLTHTTSNPARANSEGQFGVHYLIEGTYYAIITNHRGQHLQRFDDICVCSSRNLSDFGTLQELLSDRLRSYGPMQGRMMVAVGSTLHISQSGLSYSVAPEDAVDFHLETAGGVKLYAQATSAGHFNAASWNLKNDGTVDVTTQLQSAIDFAHSQNADLFIPAGVYLVTGLVIPGVAADRAQAFRIFGQGTGEPLANNHKGGTVLKSVTDAPVLRDILDSNPASNGSVTIEKIRFDGNTSSGAILQFQSFFGLSRLSCCVIYQRGTGDGVSLGWSALVEIEHCFAFNSDWLNHGVGATRTGVGWRYTSTWDGALVTIRKSTARGFHTGFVVDCTSHKSISTRIQDCQSTTVYNGLELIGTSGTVVSNFYCEGGDGGFGIKDTGDYTKIENSYISSGFAVLIDASDPTSKGTVIENNLLSIGDVTGALGIDVCSSAVFGGYNKSVRGNSIAYQNGTDDVTGVRISGTDPRLSIVDNSFDPRGSWSGTNSLKIRDNSDNGILGIQQVESGEHEIIQLSQCALSLFKLNTALTQADVTSGELVFPGGSYFRIAATSPINVTKVDGGVERNRFIVLRSENANMTFSSTARIFLAGGQPFSGPGILVLMVERTGSNPYAYEVSRTLF